MSTLQEGKVCQIFLREGFVFAGVYRGRSHALPMGIALEPAANVINTGSGGGHSRFQREGPKEDTVLGPLHGPLDLNLDHCLALNSCPWDWPEDLDPYLPREQ